MRTSTGKWKGQLGSSGLHRRSPEAEDFVPPQPLEETEERKSNHHACACNHKVGEKARRGGESGGSHSPDPSPVALCAGCDLSERSGPAQAGALVRTERHVFGSCLVTGGHFEELGKLQGNEDRAHRHRRAFQERGLGFRI